MFICIKTQKCMVVFTLYSYYMYVYVAITLIVTLQSLIHMHLFKKYGGASIIGICT